VVKTPEFGLLGSIAAILIAVYAYNPRSSLFSWSLLHQIGLYGVLAVGAAVVIISGGIDLSVGSVLAVSAIVCGKLMNEWLNPSGSPPGAAVIILSMAITLAMGLAIGLLNAALINVFRLPPFIATLATMSGLRSAATLISENRQINIPSEIFRAAGKTPEATFVTFAIVAVLLSIMMGMTVLGRHLYALGGNEAAARLSGLKITRLKAFAYGLSGLIAALAGILFAGRSGQADPRMGISYELFAITAAVVGGCSLAGGVGSVRGTVLGLVLLQILIRGVGLNVSNSTQVEGLILGTVIVAAVAVNQRLRPRL
jgi:ribose/xylose/arabinose/galactoside ABC-type transport system permease subunit